MKWNIILGSMVLGLAMCSQSFGFELLDRMLGSNGCGCDTSCCQTKCCKPKCCESKCCKPKCCESKCCRQPLFGGCNNGCKQGGWKARCCFLSGLFPCKQRCCDNGCHAKGGCAAAACGGGMAPAPAEGGDVAPVPPAPVVDPSAFLPTRRNVV